VAVKGILVFWKATPFAGRRRNEGLGRSAIVSWVSSRGTKRADDSGCPEDAEEGNVSSACATKRTHPTQAREIVACARGRVLRSVLRPVHVNPHYAPTGASLGGEAFERASRLGNLG
jgi:hypothetical protein